MLALPGGALGLGLAYAALRLLVWIAPASLPRLDEITIDPSVFVFRADGLALRQGSSSGMIPVVKHAGPDTRRPPARRRPHSEPRAGNDTEPETRSSSCRWPSP